MPTSVVPLQIPASWIVGLVGLVLLALAMKFLRGVLDSINRRRGPVYLAADSILTPAELQFFSTLRGVTPEFYICCKPRLIDLLNVPPQTDRQVAVNHVLSKHVDFVLCDPASMRPRLVIELDDRSHSGERSRQSDAVKNEVLDRAGIPLLRVPCRSRYDARDLRTQIASAIH